MSEATNIEIRHSFKDYIKVFNDLREKFYSANSALYILVVYKQGLEKYSKELDFNFNDLYSIKAKELNIVIKFLQTLDDEFKKIQESVEDGQTDAIIQAKLSNLLNVFALSLLSFELQTVKKRVLKDSDIDINEYSNETINLEEIQNLVNNKDINFDDILKYINTLYVCLCNIKNKRVIKAQDNVAKVMNTHATIIKNNINNIIKPLIKLYIACLTALEKPVGVLGVTKGYNDEMLLRCYKYEKLSKEDSEYKSAELNRPIIGELKKVDMGDEENTSNLLFDYIGKYIDTKNWGSIDNTITINMNKPEICLPFYHALHIAGYYYDYINDKPVLKKLSVEEAEMQNQLYQELYYYMHLYIEDIFKKYNYDDEKINVLIKNNSASVNKEFYSHLSVIGSSYKNVIVLRQGGNSGVLWLQYIFKDQNKQGVIENYDAKLAVGLQHLAELTNVNKPIKDISRSEQNDIINALGENANVIRSGIDDNIENVYTTIIVTDMDKYTQLPSFAYKPIVAYLEQGKKFSLSSILIGKTLQNKDVFLDFSSGTCAGVNIFADSRSGKGVMTLSILLALMAGGNPVVYGDFKPDMSLLFNNVSHILEEKSGKTTRFLACEFAQEYNPESKWYKTGKFDYDVHWQVATSENGIDEFAAKWHLTKEEKEDWLSKNLFGVIAYCKYVQLVALAGETFNVNKKKFVFVCDELGAYNIDLRNVQKTIAKKYAVLKKDKDALDKKKNKGGLTEDEERYLSDIEWCNAFCKQYIGEFTGDGGNMSANSASELASYFNKLALKKTGRTFYICIGQSLAYHLAPSGGKFTSTEAYNWSHALLAEKSAQLVQGNWKDSRDLTVDGGIGERINTEDIQKAINSHYIHGGTQGIAGFFIAAKDQSTAELCKTYLILNDNDYDKDKDFNSQDKDGYVGGMLSRFSDVNLKEKLVNTEICPNNEINELIGYPALLLKMAESDPNFIDNFNQGYDIVKKYLDSTPIGKWFKYSRPEEYIYDFHINAIPINKNMLEQNGDYKFTDDNSREQDFSHNMTPTFDEEIEAQKETEETKNTEETQADKDSKAAQEKYQQADEDLKAAQEAHKKEEDKGNAIYEESIELETDIMSGSGVEWLDEIGIKSGYTTIMNVLLSEDLEKYNLAKIKTNENGIEIEELTDDKEHIAENFRNLISVVSNDEDYDFNNDEVEELDEWINFLNSNDDESKNNEIVEKLISMALQMKNKKAELKKQNEKTKALEDEVNEKQQEKDEAYQAAEEAKQRAEETKQRVTETKEQDNRQSSKIDIEQSRKQVNTQDDNEDTSEEIDTEDVQIFNGNDIFNGDVYSPKLKSEKSNTDISIMSQRGQMGSIMVELRRMVMSEIQHAYGAFGAIKKLYIDKCGRLTIDDIAFRPKFDNEFVEYLPIVAQSKISKGNIVEFFDFSKLPKFSSLEELIVEDETVAERRIRREYAWYGKKATWLLFKQRFAGHGLYVLEIGGERIEDNYVDEEYNTKGSGFGFSIKDKLANLFAGSGHNASNNEMYDSYTSNGSIMGKLMNTTPVRAMTTALGWTVGLKATMFAASLLGPIGVFFGAVAGVTAIKLTADKYKNERAAQEDTRSYNDSVRKNNEDNRRNNSSNRKDNNARTNRNNEEHNNNKSKSRTR